MRVLLFLMSAIALWIAPVASAWSAPFMSPADVPAAGGYKKVTLAAGLDHPWGMAWLPDGGMLITERAGAVRLFKDGALSDPIPGAPEVLALGQGGLLDISLHPNFTSNHLVYFTYSTGSEKANRTTVGRAEFDGKQFSNFQELFRNAMDKPGGQHFGSRILWLKDGSFLVTIADGGNPPVSIDGKLSRLYVQNPQTHLGKVLRLKDDGAPAGGDAFGDGALPELFTMGHRNIQGMAYDPIRGAIWATEHGALGGDELNRLEAGANYGWPEATFSKDYRGATVISEHTSLPGMEDPLVVWTPCIAPSGLALYTGDVYPGWKGDLFAGALRDQSVRRILLSDDGQVEGEEIIRVGQRVRDVRQGPDGKLYILTDESDGELIRLDPSKETDPNP